MNYCYVITCTEKSDLLSPSDPLSMIRPARVDAFMHGKLWHRVFHLEQCGVQHTIHVALLYHGTHYGWSGLSFLLGCGVLVIVESSMLRICLFLAVNLHT